MSNISPTTPPPLSFAERRKKLDHTVALLSTPTPTDEQAQVVTAGTAPQLVIAGAGSGKTQTMAMRVAYCLDSGWPDGHLGPGQLDDGGGELQAGEILGLTFTRKAAGELAERIYGFTERIRDAKESASPTASPQSFFSAGVPQIMTYDSFASQIAAQGAPLLGRDPDATIINAARCYELMRQVVSEFPGDKLIFDDRTSPNSITEDAIAIANDLTSNLVTTDAARSEITRQIDILAPGFTDEANRPGDVTKKAWAPVAKVLRILKRQLVLLDLIDEYNRRKRENNWVEFSDRLALAVQAVSPDENGVPSALARQIRDQYRLILLDEFQDTSPAQLTLLRHIFAGKAVTAVGDPNQAIYGWRGASASALTDFIDGFSTAPAFDSAEQDPAEQDPSNGDPAEPRRETPVEVRNLMTAWRNSTEILNTANVTAADLRKPPPDAYERTDVKMVEVEKLAPAPNAREGRVKAGFFATEEEETAQLIADLRAALAQSNSGGKAKTAAVLSRKRKPLEKLAPALRDAGFRVEMVSQSGLLGIPEVALVRSLLEAVATPDNSAAYAHLLRELGLELGDIAQINRLGRAQRTRELALTSTERTQRLRAALSSPDSALTPEETAELGEILGIRLTTGGRAPERSEPHGSIADKLARLDQLCDRLPDEVSEQARRIWAQTLPLNTAAQEAYLSDGVRAANELSSSQAPPTDSYLRAQYAKLSPETVKVITYLAGLVWQVEQASRTGVVDAVRRAIDVLNLRIELAVAAGDAQGYRANFALDALTNQAEAFARAPGATLANFVRWMELAEERERGLDAPTFALADTRESQAPTGDTPDSGGTPTIQLLTIHAAKGLGWDVVAVINLVEGGLPSKAPSSRQIKRDGAPLKELVRNEAGWTTGDRIAHTLRADSSSLARWDYSADDDPSDIADSFAQFIEDNGQYQLREDRRLAYVATTRAKTDLFLYGSAWTKDRSRPNHPSIFLTELKDAATSGEPDAPHIELVTWHELQEKEVNPIGDEQVAGYWPEHRLRDKYQVRMAAAARVREASAARSAAPAAPATHTATTCDPASDRLAALAADVQRLVMEKNRATTIDLELSDQLSASAIVSLVSDPVAFARRWRRPIPEPPSEATSLGSQFHLWAEHAYGQTTLPGVDVTLGVEGEPAERLSDLQANFESSRWAKRTMTAAEVDVQAYLCAINIRCRIDAVYEWYDDDGLRVDLVDWKTGRMPEGDAQRAARELQVAIYRLAYARHRGIDPDRIDGYYVFVGYQGTRELKVDHLDKAEVERRITEAIAATARCEG